MKQLLSCLLVLTFATAGLAWEASESEFEVGNRAFEEKRFIEARQQYEALASQGVWTANLFYNLGSANQQAGADGPAMLNYERALVLAPGHRDAFAALDLLRKNSRAKLPPSTWRETALGLLTFDQWVTVASAAGWLAVFVILIALVRRRKMGFAARGLAFLSIIAAAGSGTAAWYKSGELNAAVVIEKQVEARVSPADRAAVAESLPAGSRVQWLTERSGWVECRTPAGGRAWVPASSVERIRLAPVS